MKAGNLFFDLPIAALAWISLALPLSEGMASNASVEPVSSRFRRVLLRDFDEADRAAFLSYQTDPRYLRLYDFDDGTDRPHQLFDLFLLWQEEEPRVNYQLGIFEASSGRMLGCGGLRKVDDDIAILGLELAPDEWGRFRLALDAASALCRLGFQRLNLKTVMGDTASGNRRVEKLARWFGAQVVARRLGPEWMQVRGWHEVDWAISRQDWEQALQHR